VSDFWRLCQSSVPPLCPKCFRAHPRELIHYVLEHKEQWWTHKGSNLGPLPCEGNALPLSYASGIFVHRSKACKSALGQTNHAVRASDLRSAGHRCQAVRTKLPGRNGSLRENAVLLKQINVIWVVQSPSQKYSRSLRTQITHISLAIPAHTEGRFAIVTDVGQGMRWTQVAH
jgi:hypothetical protein